MKRLVPLRLLRSRLVPLMSACALVVLVACGGGSGVGNNNQVGECGNGIVEGEEACDGTQLGGESCFTRGYLTGELSCQSDCTFDESDCEGENPCGNGEIDEGEACDGEALGGATCEGLGYDGGSLACDAYCELDESGCTGTPCGNGQLDAGEACDGTLLGGATCESEGFLGGPLSCVDCELDTSLCLSAAGYVVINEFYLDNPDWLELHNPTSAPVELDGMALHWWGLDYRGDPVDATAILPAYELGPGEFVVIHDELTQDPGEPVVVEPGVINLQSNISWDYGIPGAVALLDAVGALDFVRWGGDAFDPAGVSWTDDPAPLGVNIPGETTWGRRIDGVDNDLAGDWCLQEPTDATANAPCLEPLVPVHTVLITEIDVGVTGSGSADRPDAVELYNAGIFPVELEDWRLLWWSNSTQGGDFGDPVLPAYELQPGDYVTILDDAGWQGAYAEPGEGLIHVRNINWSESLSGACSLREPLLWASIDFVRWGDALDVLPPPPDTWDDAAGRLPLIPGPDGTTLGRASLVDMDLASDWCLMDESLGLANTSCL
jgi:hypothetical protein